MLVQGATVKFSKLSQKYQSEKAIQEINHNEIFIIPGIVETGGAVIVELDITDMLILQPGTIWLNGEYVSELFDVQQRVKVTVPEFKESCIVTPSKELKNITLTDERKNTKFVKLPNVSIEGKIMPIFIPTLEIARFYYAGSAHLITEVFNGGLDDFSNLLNLNQTKIDIEKKRADIWLIRNCHNDDAPIITRMKMNKYALSSAKLLYSTIVKQKHIYKNDLYFSPSCYFPFVGETNLSVLGKILDLKTGSAFFVQAILSCDHDVPYDWLSITSANSYNKRPLTKDEQQRKVQIKEEQKERSTTVIESDNRPDNELERANIVFEVPERFTALRKVIIKKVRGLDPIDDKEPTAAVMNHGKDHETSSTLKEKTTGTSNAVNMKLEEVHLEAVEMLSAFERVANHIATYAKENSLEVSALPEHQVHPSTPYGIYKFKPVVGNKRIKWHLINGRKRVALFLKVVGECGTIYLLEIEAKGNQKYATFIFKGKKEFNDASSEELLKSIVKTCGKKLKSDLFEKQFSEVFRQVHLDHHGETLNKLLKELHETCSE